MTRLASQVMSMPQGMDVTSNPTALAPNRASRLINFVPNRNGYLRGIGQMTGMNVYTAGNTQIDGLKGWDTSSQFYNLNPANLTFYLAIATDGKLNLATIQNTPLTMLPTWFASGVVSGVSLAIGSRVRMAVFGTQLLVAQDGAASNWYVNASTLDGGTLGTPDPTVAPTVTSGSGSLPAGTYYYSYSYVNYLGQESDIYLLDGLGVAYTSSGADGPDVSVPGIVVGSDKYATVNVYRSKVGGTLLYFRGQFTPGSSGTVQVITSDAASDASLGQLSPNPGENAPPLPGNIITTHLNRVWLNVSSQPYVLQYSNYGSAWQWSSLPIPATDGNKIKIESDNSDYITGLISFYSVLLIFKRHSLWGMFGQDNTSFTVQPLQLRGCTSPDTIQRCDEYVLFAGWDGIYAIDANYNPIKVSWNPDDGGIQADLDALFESTAGRTSYQNAVAYYVNRTYHIAIGNTVYSYSLDMKAWTSHVFASFGTAVINAATTIEVYSLPPLSYVGLNAYPWGVYAYDEYSTSQTITNLQFVGRPMEDRTTRKRVRGFRQYGSGTIVSGSVVFTFDNGYTETYTINPTYPGTPEEIARGCFFYYAPTAYLSGRLINATVNLNGTSIELQEQEWVFQPVE